MIYLNSAKESWVVDRFRKEWYEYNKKISTKFISRSNTIWLIAPWTWSKLNSKILNNKKVICTIHHLDMDKFDHEQEKDFLERDKFVDTYHSISEKTSEQISRFTDKKIKTIPFWLNQNIWFQINNKKKLREKYSFNKDNFLVGSFQRDTEGFDLKSPKLSKGPDRFIKIVESLSKEQKNLHVVLTGKRRHYVINELKKRQIEFSYYEMANFKIMNELYNCLDLYIVSSRVEGGPQSIFECSVVKTPIISTDVGLASEILSPESIFNMNNFYNAKPDIEYAYENVQKYLLPKGFDEYRKMVGEFIES